MGFGYLLIGYFMAFAFSLANVYFFFDIIGGAIMLIGLSKLAPHGKNFTRGVWLCLTYILLCVGRVALLLFRVVEAESAVFTVLGILISAVTLLLQFFVVAGIYFLAERVGAEKEQTQARRCILLVILYYLLHIAAYFLTPLLGTLSGIAALLVTLFGFVVLFMHLFLIHSCYCRICLSGQEDGARPRSRYTFVNRFHEKWDAIFDGAYLRTKKTPPASEEQSEDTEPGYRRVKRKKKSRKK